MMRANHATSFDSMATTVGRVCDAMEADDGSRMKKTKAGRKCAYLLLPANPRTAVLWTGGRSRQLVVQLRLGSRTKNMRSPRLLSGVCWLLCKLPCRSCPTLWLWPVWAVHIADWLSWARGVV